MNSPQIGNVQLKNRLVMAPMISNLASPDGSTSDAHIEYLARRALGGSGLIITEYTYIDRVNSRGSRNEMGIYSDLLLPKLRRLTDRIHSFGTPVFVQLVHAGGKALESLNGNRNYAPSAVDYSGNMPAEMSHDDISEAQERFAKAVLLSKKAGFDGIELHGAHGYLIQEFISPSLNRRTDRYGGSLENRIRFAQEIIDSAKSSVDLPVGIRLSLYEDDRDGYPPEYGLKVADSLKGIDYVHFSAGRFASPGSSASFYHGRGHIASRLPRKSIHPTMVVGSVTGFEDVDSVLRVADFVSIGRALLADPFFPRKYQERHAEIRPCIRCNQGCRNLSFGEVRCTVNLDTGFEINGKIMPGHLSGEIEIAGGGVKGLEAALHAVKLGLRVTLHEIGDRLGGQLNAIIDDRKKAEFQRLVGYYSNVLEKSGVNVAMNSRGGTGGIMCLPDVTYPHLVAKDEVRIDSNIYQYQDEAMALAGSCRVYMTNRSLSGLDRDRQIMYRKLAESMGITFKERIDNPDVSLVAEKQYDILNAMQSGRNAVNAFLIPRINEFL